MNLAVNQSEIESESAFTRLSLWRACVLFLLVSGSFLAVRIALVGLPPFTDGGAYSCFAYFANAGERALPAAPINFYPGCLSFLGCDPDSPLLRFRCADAAVCAVAVGLASILIYRVSNFWIALMVGVFFSSAWLHPDIGNAGFKNSILPAFGCVAAALLLFSYKDAKAHFAGGCLIPLIVLLREPMAIMAMIVLASSFILQGRRLFLFAFLGCTAGGLIGLVWLYCFRESPWQVLAAFADLKVMFAHFKTEGATMWAGFKIAVYPMLALWICFGIGLLGLGLHRDANKRPILICAAMLLAVPLLEIILKASFAYHWMQLGLALALMAAVGLHSLNQLGQQRRRLAWAIAAPLVVALFAGQYYLEAETYRNYFRQSKHFAPVMVYGNWEDPCVEECFYLSLAKQIRTQTQPEEPILVSGFYYVLYPLSQRMPVDVRTFDASFAMYADYSERHAEWLTAARTEKSPRVVIETFRMDVKPMLRDIVADYPEKFSPTYEIPVDKPIRYAMYGARVWTQHGQSIPTISTNTPTDGETVSNLR